MDVSTNRTVAPRQLAEAVVCRHGLVVIIAAAAMAGGLAAPSGKGVLDVCLISAMSLTAAILVIAYSARRVSEVQGFPLLIMAVALLRMALSVMSVKAIFSRGDAGTVAAFLGDFLAGDNHGLVISMFGVGAVVIFTLICRAIRDIRQRGIEFAADIAAFKQVGINSEVEAGFVSEEQADLMREQTAVEGRFFTAMASLWWLLVFGAVVEISAIAVNIVGGMTTGAGSSGVLGASAAGLGFWQELHSGALRAHAASTTGVGVIIQMCSLVAIVASRHLVRRNSLACLDDLERATRTIKRIEVIAKDTADTNVSAHIEQDEVAGTRGVSASRGKRTLSSLPGPAKEVYAELGEVRDAHRHHQVEKGTVGSSKLRGRGEQPHVEADIFWRRSEDNCEAYYDALGEIIEGKACKGGNGTSTVLMSAESVEELPVTVPVNVGVRLAKKGNRVLLVDLDAQRDAIAKVFEANEAAARSSGAEPGIGTCIRNLWVCLASVIRRMGNLEELISAAQEKYDCVILYAPRLEKLAEREAVASCAGYAMLFAGEGDMGSGRLGDFCHQLRRGGCEILKPEEILARTA